MFSGARSRAPVVLSALTAQGIAKTGPEGWCAAFLAGLSISSLMQHAGWRTFCMNLRVTIWHSCH